MPPLPRSIVSGDVLTFIETDSSFPAGTYTATLSIKAESGPNLNLTSTASGRDHLFALTSSDTGMLITGNAVATFSMVDGSGNRTTRRSQMIFIIPDPSKPTPPSPAQLQVDAITAAITKLATGTTQSASFNGQSFTKKNLSELYSMQTALKAQLARERQQLNQAMGISPNRDIAPRFAPTSGIGPFFRQT